MDSRPGNFGVAQSNEDTAALEAWRIVMESCQREAFVKGVWSESHGTGLIARSWCSTALTRLPVLALFSSCTGCTIFVIEVVLFYVVDDWLRHEVANAHVSANEQSNLGRRDVILDKLLYDPDVVLVRL